MRTGLIAGAVVLSVGALASVRVTAADAKATWGPKCAMCHGVDGGGKTKMGEKLGVKDYTDAAWQASRTDAALAKSIVGGIAEKKMPAFKDKLSQEDIDGLVKLVRTFKK